MKTPISILLFILVLTSLAEAQWVKIADRLLGNFPANCCGFGHITYKDGKLWAGRSSLFVSKDSGKGWTFVKSFGGIISQIDFIDEVTGLVATTDGVFKTLDGGLTWKTILDSRDCYSAQYCGNKNDIIAISDNVGFFFSSNGGNSWNFYDPGGHPHFTLANNDGTAFAFNDGGGGNLLYTSDQGLTYIPSYGLDGDSFFGARDSCERAIYIVNEGGHVDNDGVGAIYKSADEGQSWEKVITNNIGYYSAGISASGHAIYVQTISNGIDRSTDRGQSWVNIKGPSNAVDTRTICAINDNLILAVSSDGSIWRTDNSGGDSVKPVPDKVTVQLSSPPRVIDPSPRAELFVPISVRDITSQAGFDVVLHYNDRGFEYLGTFAKNGDRLDIASLSWAGRALIRFRASDIQIGTGMIGYSLFKIKYYEPYCDLVRYDSAVGSSICTPLIEWTPTATLISNYYECLLSAAEEQSQPFKLSVLPNPSKGIFSLISNEPLPNISVVLLDMLGKVAFEKSGSILPDMPMMLDLSREASGTYSLYIQNGSAVATMRIVKQ